MNSVKERDKSYKRKPYINRSRHTEAAPIDCSNESKEFTSIVQYTDYDHFNSIEWMCIEIYIIIILCCIFELMRCNFQLNLMKDGPEGNQSNEVRYPKRILLTPAVIVKLLVHVENIPIRK